MGELLGPELEGGERLAVHDARSDAGDGLADHLGDERHRARGARIDLEDVDLPALHRILHVHQPHDVERQGQVAGLLFEANEDR